MVDEIWASEVSSMVKRQNEALILLAGVVDELGGGAFSGLGDVYSILTQIEKELVK